MQISVRLYLLAICTLIANAVTAQEIPSRVNEGVNISEKGKNPKDAYAGLNLTREQQKQLQLLNRDSKQKIKEINEDSTLTGKDRKEKLQSARQDLIAKRNTILTPEQAKQYEQNVKALKAKQGQPQSTTILNNPSQNSSKDKNGLSKNSKEKASKKRGAANWNNLNLTKEQKTQIETWNDEYQMRLRTIRYDQTLKGSEKEDQIEQLVREQDLQLGSILTPEQKTIWDENQRQLKMRLSERDIKRNPRLYYMK